MDSGMIENNQFHPVIGIDLGTTYSAVASYNKETEQAEILKNTQDGFVDTTPSVISMDALTRKAIVGAWAKRNGANDPQNTIIEIKREMGEDFNAQTLQKFNAGNIFKEGDLVKAYFGNEWLMPQEISAFTLMRMKQIAEENLGMPIIDAVVTVPAYFTEKQKNATREAVLLAGLYPRQLIPEPTAAAICYGVDQFESEKKRYLVYDLGGGTFDVSIIQVVEQDVEVIATSGDPRLGGGDFDDAIRNWVLEELLRSYKLDVRTNPRALALIKLRAEDIKIKLSTFEEQTLNLGELNPQNPPMLKISRAKFEELIHGFLNKSLNYVDKAITMASKKGVIRDDIDAILLVGGSSKIPKVRQLLLEYFQKDEDFVRSDADPEAVVARGAALLAFQFSQSPQPFDILNQPSNEWVNVDLDEDDRLPPPVLITEHSLGVGVQNNLVTKIVDAGRNIPLSKTEGGFTNAGPTDNIQVQIYQGEGETTNECTHIGTLPLGPMDPQPAGHHQFEVTFSLDENGLLSVTVHHLNTGQKYDRQIDQKTAVGGNEALATMHRKLAGMFGGGVPEDFGGQAPKTFGHPISDGAGKAEATNSPYEGIFPQSGVSAAAEVATPPAVAPGAPAPGTETGRPMVEPATEQAVTTGKTDMGTPQIGSVSPSPNDVIVTPPASPPPEASQPPDFTAQNNPAPILVSVSVEVPAEFKLLVRRSQKQIEKQYNETLAHAFNQFANALNSGTSEDELIDLGDELADAFDDARLGTS